MREEAPRYSHGEGIKCHEGGGKNNWGRGKLSFVKNKQTFEVGVKALLFDRLGGGGDLVLGGGEGKCRPFHACSPLRDLALPFGPNPYLILASSYLPLPLMAPCSHRPPSLTPVGPNFVFA